MGKKESGTTITVCLGKSCADAKSKKLRARLKDLVKERGLDDRVKIKKGECAKRCAKGPVVEVKPSGKTYEHVKPKHAKKILKDAVGRKTKSDAKKKGPKQ